MKTFLSTVAKARCSFFLPGLLVIVCMFSGCSFSSSAFTKTTQDASSAFSAAATTIEYVHTGKMTRAYASSSFEMYQQQLAGLDQQLPTLSGAPGKQQMDRLLATYKEAIIIIQHPCIDTGCPWQQQRKILQQASTTFAGASQS